MSTTVETIRGNYIVEMTRYKLERMQIDNVIDNLNEQLIRAERTKNKLYWPYWTEQLLRPVLNEIKKQLPDWTCDDEQLCPMGLGCRVSVFFYKNDLSEDADKWQEGNSIYIVFMPGSLDEGELLYETGATKSKFQPNTIGAINGFNQVSKILETIEEAVTFLTQQIINF